MFRIRFCSLQFKQAPYLGEVSRNHAREARRCECDRLCRLLARSLVAGEHVEHGYGRSLTFWGKLMLSVVLWVTGRNLSMELEVTLPPYMDTVNLIQNILRLEQFYFFQYGAKRYPIRSQPILTEATHNFSPKNRRDLNFHEHLLSRNFNWGCDSY